VKRCTRSHGEDHEEDKVLGEDSKHNDPTGLRGLVRDGLANRVVAQILAINDGCASIVAASRVWLGWQGFVDAEQFDAGGPLLTNHHGPPPSCYIRRYRYS
jgi:hypothetical protein